MDGAQLSGPPSRPLVLQAEGRLYAVLRQQAEAEVRRIGVSTALDIAQRQLGELLSMLCEGAEAQRGGGGGGGGGGGSSPSLRAACVLTLEHGGDDWGMDRTPEAAKGGVLPLPGPQASLHWWAEEEEAASAAASSDAEGGPVGRYGAAGCGEEVALRRAGSSSGSGAGLAQLLRWEAEDEAEKDQEASDAMPAPVRACPSGWSPAAATGAQLPPQAAAMKDRAQAAREWLSSPLLVQPITPER